MAKSQHSIGGLFAGILAPLADAVEAETGRRLTLPGWGRVARSVAAAGLRLLADALQPKAVEPDAVPVELPTVEPVVPAYAVPDLATAEPARIAEAKPAKRPRNRIGKAAANGKPRAMASANRTTAPKGKPAKRKPAAEGKPTAPAKRKQPKRKPAAPVAKAEKKSGKSV